MEQFQHAFLASHNPDPEGREDEALMECHLKEAKRQERFIKLAAVGIEMGSPETAGKGLAEIAKFVMKRIPEHKRSSAINKLRAKINRMDPQEIAAKSTPEFAAMGQALTFIKHILIGKSADYIAQTLRFLALSL